VERIENTLLWRNYSHRRDTLTSKKATVTSVESNGQWMESLQLHPQANEVFLFHGTKSNKIDFIIQQGFEERIANEAGIFGAGIYFSENSSKSDEYITPDSNGLCKIILSRVCLGTPFVTTKSLPSIRRPPCRNGDLDSCIHDRADSVVAECERTGPKNVSYDLKRYREFIVYDRTQCYPEFLITFMRVSEENP